MARAVSVKIPTIKVIEMIESKLEQMNQTIKEYPALFNAYNKAIKEYTKSVLEIAAKNTNKIVGYNEYNYSGEQISVSFDYRGQAQVHIGQAIFAKLGDKPEKPSDPDNYSFKEKKEQLEKTLRLLRMTEQESVSASTYNSVLDLL